MDNESRKLSPEQREKIQQFFHQFDKNNTNTIDRNELATLSIALNSPLSPAELSDFFRSIDDDKSGLITMKEFIAYWER